MKRYLFLLAFLVFVQCQEMLLAGTFVQLFVTNGTSMAQASGIVGYDPATDNFTSTFAGGVKRNAGKLYVIEETPWLE